MKIRLAKLPDVRTIKVTLVLSRELKSRVESYAQLYSQLWGQDVPAAVLIPHILAQFIANDRDFQKHEKAKRLAFRNRNDQLPE